MSTITAEKRLPLLQILFFISFLVFVSGILLFRNYRSHEKSEKEFIRQERNVVTRLSYLEKMGRNDFSNYIDLLQQPGNASALHDSIFFSQFDSLSNVNSKYISSFWLLIKSGEETVTLDSLNTFRKNYLAEVKLFSNKNFSSNQEFSSKLTDSFNAYRNYHQELMNQQYAMISNLLRRSHEILVSKTKSIIGLLLCCMAIAIFTSWFAYRQYKMNKV